MISPIMTIDKDTWLWIAENKTADADKLRLSFYGDADKQFAITQIDCRNRTRRKLAETLSLAPEFIFPSTLAAQQSTSDALASFHATLIGAGDRVIDMTGGLGIDAAHVARKAAHVDYYEMNPLTAECAAHNFQLLGADNITVHCADSVEALHQMTKDSADVIFIDPARRGTDGRRLFALRDCVPDVTEMLDLMLDRGARVIIKASPMLDVSAVLCELHSVSRIMALGTTGECKELLIVCERGSEGEPLHECHTLDADTGDEISGFDYCKSDEDSKEPTYATPHTGDIIYEPYPATSKIGVRNLLCQIPGVSRLATNTDFYCSATMADSFPGAAYEIVDDCILSKKALKELAAKYPAIDVTVKNFPMTAAELAKRMRCRPSGQLRLIACTDSEGKKQLFVCRPVRYDLEPVRQ